MKRMDKRIQERDHDPYRTSKKLPDPSACTECGAMYRAGRWRWGHPPVDAKQVVCPACQRARDELPAGLVTLSGAFHREHRAEILGLIRNLEKRALEDHPLKRILHVKEHEEEVEIATASAELARSFGDALHRAYEGTLDYHYPGEGDLLRVRWER